jgi:hypothetical protein
VGANEHNVSDGGRTSEEQVCYRVVAFNAGGESPPSNTDCTSPPAAPTNLTYIDGGDGLTFDLEWTDNSAVEDGYEVFVCNGTICGRLAALPPDARGYHYDGGDYYSGDMFCVLATKDYGNSDAALVWRTFPATGSGSAAAGAMPGARTRP